ncbi:MAG: DUF4136 domain-containing protein [Bacillota bacterium]
MWLAFACLILAGCSPRIYTEQDDQARFDGFHSYAWLSPPPGKVRDPILDSQILEGRVRRAVEGELNGRGYSQVQPDAGPDFLVTYHTASKQKIESSGANFSFGVVDAFPGAFGAVAVPVGPNVESRDEGTLMVDIIDGKTKRLVWRGWTKGWLSPDNYSQDAVNSAIKQILDKSPLH